MADTFTSHLDWTGAGKGPTRDPVSFSRDLCVSIGPLTIDMSSAPGYRGDPTRINPEQLFVASLSACHALTYLFLAAKNRVAVVAYTDDADGQLEIVDGKMRMSRVTLKPHIVLENGADRAKALELLNRAHGQCFIGNSVLTAVSIEPCVEHVATSTMVA